MVRARDFLHPSAPTVPFPVSFTSQKIHIVCIHDKPKWGQTWSKNTSFCCCKGGYVASCQSHTWCSRLTQSNSRHLYLPTLESVLSVTASGHLLNIPTKQVLLCICGGIIALHVQTCMVDVTMCHQKRQPSWSDIEVYALTSAAELDTKFSAVQHIHRKTSVQQLWTTGWASEICRNCCEVSDAQYAYR